MDVRDTAAVVTGGGTGIGRSTALALARSGCRAVVVTCSRSTADAGSAVAELTAAGCEEVAERVDVADDGQVRSTADRVRARFGRVDVLVNNAGTTRAVPHADLDALTDDVVHHVLDVNVVGPLRVTRAFADDLRAARGAVVNVASISGYRAGRPSRTA